MFAPGALPDIWIDEQDHRKVAEYTSPWIQRTEPKVDPAPSGINRVAQFPSKRRRDDVAQRESQSADLRRSVTGDSRAWAEKPKASRARGDERNLELDPSDGGLRDQEDWNQAEARLGDDEPMVEGCG